MKVLLIEDDPGVREGMAEVLAEVAPVFVAMSVEGAMERIQERDIGLVVADLHIGAERYGGRVVIAEARRRNVPVILCTGADRPDVDRALGDVRPDAYLSKPFQIDEALEIATRLFRRDDLGNR